MIRLITSFHDNPHFFRMFLHHLARLAWLALLLHALMPVTVTAQTQPAALQTEAERLTALLPGRVGAALVHLESGRAVYLDADTPYPMASTVKIPVAVHLLKLVDEGVLRLNQHVTLEADDIYPQMGGPMDRHLTAGSAISVRDLLHMMITVSDNNATDILIRLGGGTEAVHQRMQVLGFDGIRVDRFIWELLANYFGAEGHLQAGTFTPADYGAWALAERSRDQRSANIQRWNQDRRDTATARSMALLLQRIWQDEVLSPESTQVLQEIMQATYTGAARLKGHLPRKTVVAHKTGTVGDAINDVGVITLPDGRGHVLAVVFVLSEADSAQREDLIAQLARAAHDYFLFVP